MSRAEALSYWQPGPGESPSSDYITPSDALASVNEIYDDMAGIVTDGSVTESKLAAAYRYQGGAP